MMSMSPDVNKDHRTADARRIKSPPGWHVLAGEIPLNVLKVKLTDGSNRPCADHGPGLPHHRVARVAVRKAELGASRLDLARKACGRVEVRRQRLVADNV